MAGTSLKWVQSTLPTSASWESVAYGNGKFVAIALNSDIAAYSTDGTTWTQSTLPASANWRLITYGSNKFVVIAIDSDIIAYSTDGVTWAQAQTGLSSNPLWQSIAYGDGKFVAVAYYSEIAAAYSTDGITWSKSSLPEGTWRSVAYGNGKFVVTAPESSIVAYSTDGITWTQVSVSISSPVTYGNGKFVILSGSSVLYSTDGITWSSQETLPVVAFWTSLTYGGNNFMGVSKTLGRSLYSEDGITWVETTLPYQGNWPSVTYGNDKFVAIASDSAIAAYSAEVPQYTFTITPTPSDATVALTATGFIQSGNSIVVDEGTTVSYAVSKKGYVTKTGTYTVTADYTLLVRLVREVITEGFSSIDLSKFNLSVGNTVCVEGMVPIPDLDETVVTLTSAGKTIESKTGSYIKGSTVDYVVSHPYFTPASGSTRMTESKTITVTIDEFAWYTLTINPSQSGSTIIFTSEDGYQTGTNTYRVHDGSSITYKVEKTGYVTITDTVTLTEDTTIDVTQSLSWMIYTGDSYTGEQSTDANYDLGLKD